MDRHVHLSFKHQTFGTYSLNSFWKYHKYAWIFLCQTNINLIRHTGKRPKRTSWHMNNHVPHESKLEVRTTTMQSYQFVIVISTTSPPLPFPSLPSLHYPCHHFNDILSWPPLSSATNLLLYSLVSYQIFRNSSFLNYLRRPLNCIRVSPISSVSVY